MSAVNRRFRRWLRVYLSVGITNWVATWRRTFVIGVREGMVGWGGEQPGFLLCFLFFSDEKSAFDPAMM